VSEGYTLKSMAQIYVDRRRYADAERMLDGALAITDKIGAPRLTAQVTYALAELQLRRGRPEPAADALTVVLRITRETGDVVGQAFALACTGSARLMLGDFAGAESALSEALDLARRAGNRLIRGRSLLGLAELYLGRDEEHLALARVEEAIVVFREHGGEGVWQARALDLLGRIHERAGRPGIAVHAWQAAAELADCADAVLAEQIARSLTRVRSGPPELRQRRSSCPRRIHGSCPRRIREPRGRYARASPCAATLDRHGIVREQDNARGRRGRADEPQPADNGRNNTPAGSHHHVPPHPVAGWRSRTIYLSGSVI
jgi:hypothetical protein